MIGFFWQCAAELHQAVKVAQYGTHERVEFFINFS